MKVLLEENEAEKFNEEIKEHLINRVIDFCECDRLLTRKEVCELILQCSTQTADAHFLYAKGFPFVDFGTSGRRYPKKAVEKWIEKQTKYN